MKESAAIQKSFKISPHSDLKSTKQSSFFKPFFQTKLTINQPGDVYEQEADAVAERIMRIPVQNNEQPFFQSKPLAVTPVQRKCAACEHEEKLQRKEEDEEESIQLKPVKEFSVQRKCDHCEEEEKLQLKETSTATGGMTVPSTVNNVINSTGQSMDKGTRNFMESRLGYDFSNVQIHNDPLAHQSSKEINALAYTHGNHVVFGTGQYQPNSNSGKKLLAHELTHVVQQGIDLMGSKKIQRQMNYVRPLPAPECQPFLSFETSLQALESNSQHPNIPLPEDILQAIRILRRFKEENRITCWEISGGRFYASYDNLSGEIRLHTNFGNATSPLTILHEAIHALHAARHPEIAQIYGRVLAEGGSRNESLAILMIKFKAWTEYWAYRRTAEFYNSRQTESTARVNAHERAMREREVRSAVHRVVGLTGRPFDPSQWNPPARWHAPSEYRH